MGGGPTGLQGRLSSLQGHYLWRGATLISSRFVQDPPAPPPPLVLGQCRALWVGVSEPLMEPSQAPAGSVRVASSQLSGPTSLPGPPCPLREAGPSCQGVESESAWPPAVRAREGSWWLVSVRSAHRAGQGRVRLEILVQEGRATSGSGWPQFPHSHQGWA